MNNQTKCGFVAIVGLPNAGKSTLTNALVGAKVSIATRRVQTTRHKIRGIICVDKAQLVFIDTPGIFDPTKNLEKAMVKAALSSIYDVDCVLVVVDTPLLKHTKAEVDTLITRVQNAKIPFAIVLNKIDALNTAQDVLPLIAYYADTYQATHVFPVSARKEDNVENLKKTLIEMIPEGPWMYPEDQLSDQPEQLMAEEITRKYLIEQLGQELPYQLMVQTEKFVRRTKKIKTATVSDITIHQNIVVGREPHKKMVIGSKGEKLKGLGLIIRRELKNFLGCEVHLFLNVKVDPKWRDKRDYYDYLGLDFPAN
ncbi:MAG: GTPase Era [Alphaproteobacteria bacterium]|nr:MAG: GTPase Era [Alphaproteobacteria bacterium]